MQNFIRRFGREILTRIRPEQVRFPEPVIGSINEVWNTFFRGLNLDFANQNNVYEAFLMFLSLNLMGIRDPQQLLPQNIRNALQTRLNNINQELQNLDNSLRNIQRGQLRGNVAAIRNAIRNILQRLSTGGYQNPQELRALSESLERLFNLLNQQRGQQLYQQIQQNIQALNQEREALQKILSQNLLPLEIINLRDIYVSEEFYRNITRNNRRARILLGEGLERIRRHLASGGIIRINIGNQAVLQNLQDFLSGKGVQLNLIDANTNRVNNEVLQRLGIIEDPPGSGNYGLSLNPARLIWEGVESFEDLENRIGDRFQGAGAEARQKQLEARRDSVNQSIENLPQGSPERRFLEIYREILNEANRIENASREILNKFALTRREAFLSGKKYDKYVAERILEYAAFIESLDRQLDEIDNTAREVIERRRSVTPEMIRNFEISLERFREVANVFENLRQQSQSWAPGEIKPLPKRLWEAGKNIATLLGYAGIIPLIFLGAWGLAAFITPFGLITWAMNQVEGALKRGSSSGK
jgi:uncharacterized protein Yka (UPF0111/DUF47 family)